MSPPRLGLGTWYMRGNTTEAVAHAIELGYRHIDCAKIYGNQRAVGAGIAAGIKQAGITRKDIWVTSKLWNSDHGSPESALKETLRELGLDHLDLYLMHFPVGAVGLDYAATWKRMEGLVGKSQGTRFIGIANHSPAMIENLMKSAKVPPHFHQFEGHPYLKQDNFIETNFKHNITVTNYAPLGNTSPTYAATGAGAPKLLANSVITAIAKERNCAPAQVVLAWNMRRNVIVIPKAIKKAHQIENFGSEKCALTSEDIAKIHAMKYNIRMLSYPCATAANACFAGL